MTLDLLLELLYAHLAALRSSAWPQPHGPSTGPAFYLDEADTGALIAEITRFQEELAAAGVKQGIGSNGQVSFLTPTQAAGDVEGAPGSKARAD